MQYFPASDNMLDITVLSASLLPKLGEVNPTSKSQAGVRFTFHFFTIFQLYLWHRVISYDDRETVRECDVAYLYSLFFCLSGVKEAWLLQTDRPQIQSVLRPWDRDSLMYSGITNKTQRYTIVFITINVLHVSGRSSVHHQELKTVYTASGICRAFSVSYRYREWVETTHSRWR